MGSKERTIRVGIIGCGKIAFSKHLPCLSQIKDVEICAFHNRTKAKAISAANQFGCKNYKIYDDYSELLNDKTVDVVHICTPNISHGPISIAALEAGKHVLCEKPMAMNAEEAKAMTIAAKKSGKLLSISYQNRFRESSLALKRICENGDLGKIYYAKAHAIRRRKIPTWGDFLNKDMQGGGSLIDIGSHALDLTLWLMNNYEPQLVVGSTYDYFGRVENIDYRMTPECSTEYNVDDAAFGFIRMKNGATIILESSWALNTLEIGEAQTTLCGTKAGADMKKGLRINGVQDNNLYTKEIEFNTLDNPGQREIESWIHCIRTNCKPVVHSEHALVVAEIIDAIYHSANTGQPVLF